MILYPQLKFAIQYNFIRVTLLIIAVLEKHLCKIIQVFEQGVRRVVDRPECFTTNFDGSVVKPFR